MKKQKKKAGMIGAKEVADALGVDPGTIINDADAGRIPCIRVGSRGMYRFTLAKVIEAYKSRKS